MTLAKFREDPWKTSHRAYSGSPLAMAPAPEYASSEVILSSLYRVSGFPGVAESRVPQNGRDLDREIQKFRNRRRDRDGAALDPDSFHMMLHSALESPKLPNQSSKRFLQITPLVPQAVVFSGSARLAGNPWSAGTLVRRMIWLGSPSHEAAQQNWKNLFRALSVARDDDIFARFLEQEMTAWGPTATWGQEDVDELASMAPEDRVGLAYPARQFTHDLTAIIGAKGSMTRRQWTSLLESILRIGTVSHVVWLSELHGRMWSCLRQAISGAGPRTESEARSALFPKAFSYLSYGDRALPTIKDRASAFLQARLGINAVLWGLEEIGHPIASLGSAVQLLALCDAARARSSELRALDVLAIVDEVQERENRAILCRKGIGSNIMEFARHVLGQRQAASDILRGYDQGYVLRKKSSASSSPWVVALGPVAVLALVHCSLSGTSGPRSVRRLSQHLQQYGISVDHRDIPDNDLGHQLRMLGLVLDSPDAESGMLLVSPFPEARP
ncbi:hypothetical protein [Phyllobacterium sp. P30BS-XVII]|uniref:hypothetical protein n=1 Tax=Phyllobacterium sp. P30BS-XVII TaxID=2587046 RepID=UPI0015F96528|nr:hypothetical protein [Phyllobacterium sp. P30BS-XVII]MBA8903106.1 hypothetical protein [Phyllobacterium sp. P30BS-XVII]